MITTLRTIFEKVFYSGNFQFSDLTNLLRFHACDRKHRIAKNSQKRELV